jgi:hypothetical protein
MESHKMNNKLSANDKILIAFVIVVFLILVCGGIPILPIH